MVSTVRSKLGTIDILVNNSASNPALASVLDTEERLWDIIMNVNLKGIFFVSLDTAETYSCARSQRNGTLSVFHGSFELYGRQEAKYGA